MSLSEQLPPEGSAQTVRFFRSRNHTDDNTKRSFQETEFIPETADTLEGHSLDILDGDFGGLFDTIISRWHEWGEIFNIQTRPCPLYEEIMAEKTGEE